MSQTAQESHVKDYYTILQISRNASEQEIRDAYQKLKSLYDETNQAFYSLASSEDLVTSLSELEEAYQFLSRGHNQKKNTHHAQDLVHRSGAISAIHDEEKKPFFGVVTQKKLLSPSALNKNFQEEIQKILAKEDLGDGATYKKIRDLSGITLQSLQDHIKVSQDHLNHIEENRFDCLPQAVYVKGFLKSYLTFLGIKQSEQLVSAYMLRLRHWSEKNRG